MDLAKVLNYLRPDAQWTLNGDEYAGLVWIGPGEPPSEAECVAAWPTVQTALENAQTEINRRTAFQLEADPLFFGWQRGENTEQAWRDKCDEIRARYPYQ